MTVTTKPKVVREALTEVAKIARVTNTTRGRAWLKVAEIASEEELIKLGALLTI